MACLNASCSGHFSGHSNDCSDIAVCPICGKFTSIVHDEFGPSSNPYVYAKGTMYDILLNKSKKYAGISPAPVSGGTPQSPERGTN